MRALLQMRELIRDGIEIRATEPSLKVLLILGALFLIPVAAAAQGGRGNAAAALFTTTCAPCHGADLAGGPAPTLFAERLLASNDDETPAERDHRAQP